ncbi:CHAT domain-containing protein [Scytonema sp. UIC 10036]|uniref:CHAT domain-containing protein n=1 Tax=Scytonema sp. UIC 10036 TaxID=2304196 RepID=UPI0012DAEA8D|nr:CHAT domain-containing protein [Scytonema sp. UIC 10036]MUG94128.1 CHAT domain-containing protein [Scytonema sp. UIC 10036]
MAKNRQYVDFNLELRDLDISNNTFNVSVPISDVGETREAFLAPYLSEEMEEHLIRLERKNNLPLSELVKFGKQITARLFPSSEITNLFQRAIEKAGQDGCIRIRLVIKHSKLAQIPWEFCYLPQPEDEDSYDNFLVLNPKYSMVRYESVDSSPLEIQKENQASLRLLAVTADPIGNLQLKMEQKAIEKALKGFDVKGINLSWQPFLNNPTVDNLISELHKGADFFHFAGHGVFTEEKISNSPEKTRFVISELELNILQKKQASFLSASLEIEDFRGIGNLLLLSKETEDAYELFPANELAIHLRQAGVRVAVLGACETGRSDDFSPWTGIAPALMKQGIPAVLAMQYKVFDNEAIAFSKRFYTALAAGLTLDEAVSLGRREMYNQAKQGYEWAIPVLYMRSSDGIVFPEITKRELPTANDLRVEGEAQIKNIKGGKFSVIKIEEVVKATYIGGKLVADDIENSDVQVVAIEKA